MNVSCLHASCLHQFSSSKVSGRLDIRNSSSSVSRGGAGVRVAGNMVLGGNATFQNMSTKASGGAIWAKSILQTGAVLGGLKS